MSIAATAPRLALGLALALLAGGACGRKTDVRPPTLVAPARITDLTATNGATGVALGWQRPKQTADGQGLFDLDAFVVERAAAGLPFAFLTRIQVPDRDRLRQQRRFTHLDATAELGERYRYRVLAVTVDGYISAPSNVVELVRAIPAPTPTPEATPRRTP